MKTRRQVTYQSLVNGGSFISDETLIGNKELPQLLLLLSSIIEVDHKKLKQLKEKAFVGDFDMAAANHVIKFCF